MVELPAIVKSSCCCCCCCGGGGGGYVGNDTHQHHHDDGDGDDDVSVYHYVGRENVIESRHANESMIVILNLILGRYAKCYRVVGNSCDYCGPFSF